MALTAKQGRFVEEYLIDLNATQAAIRAGYSKKTARSQGQRLLTYADIQAAIADRVAKISEEADFKAKDVLERLIQVATADPNELVKNVVGSCRYCHGIDHKYQWRIEEEFDLAQEAHFELPDEARVKKVAPVIAGGFGYTWKRPPHPDCPNCDGFGISRVVLMDTTQLSPAALALYAGVKETQHGVEIKMHDQAAALERIARHLGMFVDRKEITGKDGGPVQTVTTNMTPQEAAEAYQATLVEGDG